MSENLRLRNKKLTLRLTEEEKEILINKYKNSNKKTIREFILELVIRGIIVNIDLSEILVITNSINKLGVNINQIARNVNQKNYTTLKQLEKVQQLLKDINDKQDTILSKLMIS